MILNDKKIIQFAENGMITPFEKESIKQIEGKKILSYGVSPFGYDFRLDNKFKIPKLSDLTIDPKENNDMFFHNVEQDWVLLRPNSFILAKSFEYFKIPNNLTGLVYGKSSYARIGVVPNGMPIDGGWEGYYTLQISNLSKFFIKIYAFEGIAQIVFFEGDAPNKNYEEKGGNYQNSNTIITGINYK